VQKILKEEWTEYPLRTLKKPGNKKSYWEYGARTHGAESVGMSIFVGEGHTFKERKKTQTSLTTRARKPGSKGERKGHIASHHGWLRA